jgi:hypothetical protein
MPSDTQRLSKLAGQLLITPAAGDFVYGAARQLGGRCRVTGSAEAEIESLDDKQLIHLRHWIWRTRQQGAEPVVTSEIIRSLDTYRLPPFDQRAMDVLKCLFAHTRTVGEPVFFRIQDDDSVVPELATIMGVHTGDNTKLKLVFPSEISFVLDYLVDQGWITRHPSEEAIVVSPQGVIELDRHRDAVTISTQIFVAMWFSEQTNLAWQEGFAPAIGAAGYSPFRIDQHQHDNRIDDEIIAQIRRSRCLVADFTCGKIDDVFVARGGVYYEAGFAQALGLPVFWTVRQECLDGLHFDTRQFPHIVWNDPGELRKQLQDRIEARLGRGPLSR